eukprot:gene24144-9730_t
MLLLESVAEVLHRQPAFTVPESEGGCLTCIGAALAGGVNMLLESVKEVLQRQPAFTMPESEGGCLTCTGAALAGGSARGLTAILLCPVTVVKTRMEYSSPTATKYSGTASALYSIATTEGVRGLFKGLVPTVITNAPFSALYYMFYTHLKRQFADSSSPKAATNFVSGTVAAHPGHPYSTPTPLRDPYSTPGTPTGPLQHPGHPTGPLHPLRDPYSTPGTPTGPLHPYGTPTAPRAPLRDPYTPTAPLRPYSIPGTPTGPLQHPGHPYTHPYRTPYKHPLTIPAGTPTGPLHPYGTPTPLQHPGHPYGTPTPLQDPYTLTGPLHPYSNPGTPTAPLHPYGTPTPLQQPGHPYGTPTAPRAPLRDPYTLTGPLHPYRTPTPLQQPGTQLQLGMGPKTKAAQGGGSVGAIAMLRHIVKTQGAQGLMSGLNPRVLEHTCQASLVWHVPPSAEAHVSDVPCLDSLRGAAAARVFPAAS